MFLPFGAKDINKYRVSALGGHKGDPYIFFVTALDVEINLFFCNFVLNSRKVETLRINIINQDAIAILKGMEQAGLIMIQKQEIKHKNLSKKLRWFISSARADEMIETIGKERAIINP